MEMSQLKIRPVFYHFKRQTYLPIFIRNYSRSYYSPDLKTVPTSFVSPIFAPKNREKINASHS